MTDKPFKFGRIKKVCRHPVASADYIIKAEGFDEDLCYTSPSGADLSLSFFSGKHVAVRDGEILIVTSGDRRRMLREQKEAEEQERKALDDMMIEDPGDPVLMGADNPDGWALEELLLKLQREIHNKTAKIIDDDRFEARTVAFNNLQIIGLLRQAEAIQRQSYNILDHMAPNEGPLGKPRIGKGSKG